MRSVNMMTNRYAILLAQHFGFFDVESQLSMISDKQEGELYFYQGFACVVMISKRLISMFKV